ncbi:hypothetical protein [Sediminibacterium sp.]|uniref:hypothetical protein n=1 Tax=Sediminibacterium sp. TaxID=1917865 RepID=UPI003F72407E
MDGMIGSINAGISSFQSPLVLMKGRVFMEGMVWLGDWGWGITKAVEFHLIT